MNLSQMKYYKQQKGYSFAKLSELSGVPVGTIQKIFNGETKTPRYDTLMALSEVLRPDPETLIIRDSMPISQAQQGNYTVEDYYTLPEDRRVELIDGYFYDMASPTVNHQLLIGEVYVALRTFISQEKGKCTVLAAPLDVQLDCDERTMVQPDILVVCDESKMKDRCVMGAPDLIIEILSASTRKKDMFLKLMKYENAGVREYWMVDLEKERIITYFFEEDETATIYGLRSKITVKIFEGKLEIDFGAITEYMDARGQKE